MLFGARRLAARMQCAAAQGDSSALGQSSTPICVRGSTIVARCALAANQSPKPLTAPRSLAYGMPEAVGHQIQQVAYLVVT
eukprot:2620798-Amphidinium_carterae.3